MITIEEIQIEPRFLGFAIMGAFCFAIGFYVGRRWAIKARKSQAERTLQALYEEYGEEMFERSDDNVLYLRDKKPEIFR